MFWPFRKASQTPTYDLLNGLNSRLEALEREQRALRDDMAAWEARGAKLVRELSRTYKSLAEVQRREELKGLEASKPVELPELELEEPEQEDLLTRTLRYSRGG